MTIQRQPFTSSSGQILVAALIILVIVMISVPALINYIDREAKWTTKQTQATRAFQLAEAAAERGYQKLIMSTSTWASATTGTTITGYNFDQTYTATGGTYEIRFTSGPGTSEVTVTGVGRDSSNKEIRAVKTTYGDSLSDAALYSMKGVNLTSNPDIEWGMVMCQAAIVTDKDSPRMYTAGNISWDTNGGTPPNSDNLQWWSYYPTLPPPPQIDTEYYRTHASTTLPNGYSNNLGTLGTSASPVIIYSAGDITLKSSSFITGALVVMGNLTLQGSAGSGSYSATLPSTAWKEYCKNSTTWATYRAWNGAAPASCPGLNSGWSPSGAVTASINNVVCHGFMYVGGSFTITGGGNCTVHGTMFNAGNTDLSGSHVKVYYDDSSLSQPKTLNVSLNRNSWQEITSCSWSGSHPTCP